MSTQTKKINHYYLGMLMVLAMMAAMLLAAKPSYASTTFTVNSTADTQELTPGLAGDVVTLRDAIARANSNGNPTQVDKINFNIPGTGVHTITPGSALPLITEPVIVDGYTQPGASPNTKIVGEGAVVLWHQRELTALQRREDHVARAEVQPALDFDALILDHVRVHVAQDQLLREVGRPDDETVAPATASLLQRILPAAGEDATTNVSTPNDPGDADKGSNNLQNKPSLASARTASGKTTVKGTLNSRPGATYKIQFFSNPSGTNEGRTFIGQKAGLNVDGSGHASFTFALGSKVAAGQTITATATNEFTEDTSEFSAPRKVVSS